MTAEDGEIFDACGDALSQKMIAWVLDDVSTDDFPCLVAKMSTLRSGFLPYVTWCSAKDGTIEKSTTQIMVDRQSHMPIDVVEFYKDNSLMRKIINLGVS